MDELKTEHSELFSWLLPLPGDWHTLLNFQPVLKKMFLHAGLEELAVKFGYVEGSVKGTLEENKFFWRNRWFIFETWEGMFRAMLFHFLKEKGYDVDQTSLKEKVWEFERRERFTGSEKEAEELEAALLGRIQKTLNKAGVADSKALRDEFVS
jgi:hypothetical protein